MRSLLLCCLFSFLFGCGVAASVHNQNALDEINAGDSYESVVDRLMLPKGAESFYELGHNFKVVKAKAGDIANPMPFVFMDGMLVGYGYNFYDRFNRARNNPSVFGKMIDQMMMAPPSNITPPDSGSGQGV